MKTVLITGSAGLVGSHTVVFFVEKGFRVVGIDNDMRSYFFGKEASTKANLKHIERKCGDAYIHSDTDVRDKKTLNLLFKKYEFDLIIHAAAQPSHDWAARQPHTDFEINAGATLLLLENFRRCSPRGVFIFTSTNKVYGDSPNQLPFIEQESRWELEQHHRYFNGIDETMSIDCSLHSLFGVSKAAADLLVQEYGRYFNLKTASFRCGCLVGPQQKGAELHGFLAYLARCIAAEKPFTIYGYKGKQVRDILHAYDLVSMFWHFYQNPRSGQVYNAGGGRHANISINEAITYLEKKLKKKALVEYSPTNRIGDHLWYVSNIDKFRSHYPSWNYTYDSSAIIDEFAEQAHLSNAVSQS